MKNRKLKTRQRTYLTTQMKWVIGTTVVAAFAIVLIIYFNIFNVRDTNAFGSGDYRTVESGDWSDAQIWEVFDGTDWTQASMPPGMAAGRIVVTPGNHLTITDELVITEMNIDSGATVSLECNAMHITKKKGAGQLTCKGSLQLNACIIDGDGDFVLGPEATLSIGSDAGISKKSNEGNLQLKGKKDLSKSATYIFNGTVRQQTGNGLPGEIATLIVDNIGGVDMDMNLQVTTELNLKKGVLSTGKYQLITGTSVNNTGAFNFTNGSVRGKWNAWYNVALGEPIGFVLSDGDMSRNISFVPQVEKYRKGMIELVYREELPDDSRKSPFEARQIVVAITRQGHFNAMLSNGPEEAWMRVAADPAHPETIIWNIESRPDNQQPESTAARSFSNLISGPDPFDQQIVVRFYSDQPTFAMVQLTGANGKPLSKKTEQVEPGYNQVVLQTDASIPDGAYTLQVSNLTDIQTCRITKTRQEHLTQAR